MDNALATGSGSCRFESHCGQDFFITGMWFSLASLNQERTQKTNGINYEITPNRYCFSLGYDINLSVCMSAKIWKFLTKKRT